MNITKSNQEQRELDRAVEMFLPVDGLSEGEINDVNAGQNRRARYSQVHNPLHMPFAYTPHG